MLWTSCGRIRESPHPQALEQTAHFFSNHGSPAAPHRAPGHGCVLRVRRRAALPATARRAAGHRRAAGALARARARRPATRAHPAVGLRPAARLPRARRHHHRQLRRPATRRRLGHGLDESRAAVPGRHSAAGGLRRLPCRLARLQGGHPAPCASDGGPRYRRGLHRLHPRPGRTARRRACAGRAAAARHPRRHGAELLDRRGTQQAAGQNRQRPGQTRWHHPAGRSGRAHPPVAPALPQDPRHRPAHRRAPAGHGAAHHRRAGRLPARDADRALWRQSA